MQFDIQDDIDFLQSAGVLKSLLADKTTGRHILWGTDAYADRGLEYARDQEIEIGLITGENGGLLKTRAQKAAGQQSKRTRQHAEVFTPAWICRMMNDQADREWFGREEVFFRKGGTDAKQADSQQQTSGQDANPDAAAKPTERVDFKGKSWRKYVDSKRLEITCGEAPYLVSRYDVSSGEPIPLNRRAGLLDRKLRVVNENTDTEADWLKWAFRAYEATYGYEFQGDNLLIARVNLMMTFGEYLKTRWQRQPTLKEWKRLARVVVWNIWQMDGLTCALPYAKGHEMAEQTEFLSAFGYEPAQEESAQPSCRIYLWRYLKASTEFRKIKEGTNGMRFDFVIGNPPYQDETQRNNGYAAPIYNSFLDGAYSVGQKVELIHPARFLFNAGSTPKEWNQKMLNDPHLKVIYYEKDSSHVFSGVDIKGGVAITYRDKKANFGAIEIFVENPIMNNVLHKVKFRLKAPVSSVAFVTSKFNFSTLLHDYPECNSLLKERRLATNVLDILDGKVFFEYKPDDENDYIHVYGRIGTNRVYRWIKRKYIEAPENMDCYKVFLPKVNGIGAFGETIVDPIIGSPGEVNTHTFMSIGSLETKYEGEALLKYVKTKFARAMLGVLKITQHNSNECWKYVPLQDFTPSSDIDWSQSIPDIDRQLYAKYGLDESEIAFIESHVKEMV